jgi:hypothetical protein
MPSPDYSKLCLSISQSRRVLRWPRQQRLELAREAAGDHYSEGGARRQVKVNLLSLYQSIMSGLLVANDPRFILTTADPGLLANVRIEREWLNEQAVRMNLGETGRDVVIDALYGMGFCKVALASPCDAVKSAWDITAGEPIAIPIDFDDVVFDVGARRPSGWEYVGHRYSCPKDVAIKMYGSKAKALSVEHDQNFNREGDERIGRLLRGTYTPESFEESVELWEVYLPRYGKVVTLADQDVLEAGPQGESKPLWEQNWIGPPWGPILTLGFNRVPGSSLAKGPMQDLFELHLDCNHAHRKANITLRNLKELTTYQRQNDNDASSIKHASHLDLVPVDSPESIKPLMTGGGSIQGILVAAEQYRNLFNEQGGNLSLMGGRSPQAKTLGQEKIVAQNAGGTVEVMRTKVNSFMASVGETLLWFAHYHPELVMKRSYKPSGSRGRQLPLYPPPTPEKPQPTPNRGYALHRTAFRLDPVSIRFKSPEERLAFINQTVQTFTPLMMGPGSQQGIMLDMRELLEILADYGDAPEVRRIYTIGQQGDAGGPSHERTMQPQTERTYTRQNEPAQPQQGGPPDLAQLGGSDFTGTRPQMSGAA